MKKGFLLFMILPLCLVLFSNAAYRHQHVLPDGQRIEHAHPFQSCPDNSGNDAGHRHTDREILLYTLITDSPVIVTFLPLILVVYRPRESDLGVLNSHPDFLNEAFFHRPLRAPPPSFWVL